MTIEAETWQRELTLAACPERMSSLTAYYKTGPGDYAEGDVFIATPVPEIRRISRPRWKLPPEVFAEMLDSPIHEFRLAALIALVERNEHCRDDMVKRKETLDFYLAHTAAINNWDLVDQTAHKIVGEWMLRTGDYSVAMRLAGSTNMWEQRIAMISTWRLMGAGMLDLTFTLAARLMGHPHDLIRKTVGWMLREAGRRDRPRLEAFLDQWAATMPRVTLRVAVERFDNPTRRYYMTLTK